MRLSRRQFLHLAVGAVAFPTLVRGAKTQAYPTRPIRLVIPFPAGALFDVIGRSWANKMNALLGPVVIENVSGAGGSVGAATVARARPDGYTLLLSGTQTHVNDALLKTRPLYDPVRDLDPIASMVVGYLCIAVHPSVPAQTLQELVAYAKTNPGKLSYGHAGLGTLNHLTGELLKLRTGTADIVQVPYRGASPVIADLISGQIPMGAVAISAQQLEFHRSGKLRILAVASPRRLIAAPEIPTTAETGVPGMTVKGSIGLLAPAKTPRAIIEQIAEATRTMLVHAGYQKMLIEAGLEPTIDASPEEFRQSLASDIGLWTPVVKALGLKID